LASGLGASRAGLGSADLPRNMPEYGARSQAPAVRCRTASKWIVTSTNDFGVE
jgi:hypothetical protein